MSTLLEAAQVDAIVKAGAAVLAEFIEYASTHKLEGLGDVAHIADALKPLSLHVVELSAEYLIATRGLPRIEIRGKGEAGRAAQVAIIGIPLHYRDAYQTRLQTRLRSTGGVSVRKGGALTLEINALGVDKALAIRYSRQHFQDLVNVAGYRAGKHVHAAITRTAVIADGDGTTYGKPTNLGAPVLRDSPVLPDLVEYLDAGGVFIIVSGNDGASVGRRITQHAAVPPRLLRNVFFFAYAGANLCYFKDGMPVEMSGYPTTAIDRTTTSMGYATELDCIYIGDDGSPTGNDWPAFESVGFDRSVSVASDLQHDHLGRAPHHVGGHERGTAFLLREINDFLKRHPAGDAVFSSAAIEKMVEEATRKASST